jgi:hypothetical protein
MYRAVPLLLLVMLGTVNSSACSGITTCAQCTTTSTWGNTCRWCEIDRSCHDHLSLENTCHTFENIHKPEYCQCSGCVPQAGLDSSICTWYDTATGASDPTAWDGGDFLPLQYQSAAVCACSGGTNRLYATNPPAASCVRTALIRQHKAINGTMRQFIKKTPYIENYKYVDFFYDMHVRAYKECCCSGTPAPKVAWYGIFYASAVMPCNYCPVATPSKICPTVPTLLNEIAAIFETGRCGCGW